jgi:hypothetical protein
MLGYVSYGWDPMARYPKNEGGAIPRSDLNAQSDGPAANTGLMDPM